LVKIRLFRDQRALPTTLAFEARNHFLRAAARASVSYKIFDITGMARSTKNGKKVVDSPGQSRKIAQIAKVSKKGPDYSVFSAAFRDSYK